MATIAELLQTAAAFCRSMQFGQAETTYRQILCIDPGSVQTHISLGNALRMQRRFVEAEAAYRDAVRLQPTCADAHNNLGAVLRAQGRLGEAEQSFREALRHKPGFVEVSVNLGNVLRAQNRLTEAEETYREAVRLRPGFAEAHNNLGNALHLQHRLADAEAAYREALRLKPDYAEAHNNLGNVLRERGRDDEGEAEYREAIRLRPGYAEAFNNLADALRTRGQAKEAEAACREAIRWRPDLAEAHNNLGNVLSVQGRLTEAEEAFRKALQIRASYPEAHNNLSLVLRDQGRMPAAEAACREAVRIRPDYAEAHAHLGTLLLSQGKFTEGWAEYEWRWRVKGRSPRVFDQPLWDGKPLGDGSLLLHAEQGLGDTLQFVRLASLVKQYAATVVLECQPALVPLLSLGPKVDHLLGRGSPLLPFDAHLPLLSLPSVLPAMGDYGPLAACTEPYLSTDPALVQKWRERLRSVAGFRIGIAWQGNRKHPEQHRFMPLQAFAPLAAVPGVSLISLQRGAGVEQLAELDNTMPVVDLGDGVDEAAGTFMDTAAVMRNIDLVVTADTAIGHLAGGLGVPVWIAMSFVPDWRWLRDRDDSPWYPSVRLFRQTRLGDWTGVFERMAATLRQSLGR